MAGKREPSPLRRYDPRSPRGGRRCARRCAARSSAVSRARRRGARGRDLPASRPPAPRGSPSRVRRSSSPSGAPSSWPNFCARRRRYAASAPRTCHTMRRRGATAAGAFPAVPSSAAFTARSNARQIAARIASRRSRAASSNGSSSRAGATSGAPNRSCWCPRVARRPRGRRGRLAVRSRSPSARRSWRCAVRTPPRRRTCSSPAFRHQPGQSSAPAKPSSARLPDRPRSAPARSSSFVLPAGLGAMIGVRGDGATRVRGVRSQPCPVQASIRIVTVEWDSPSVPW